MEAFRKLGLSKELIDVLRKLNFKEPTEIQEKAIPLLLKGRDVIGGSETGSGKTLAFASAIIENLKPNRRVQALILTPTRELAEQVAKSIRNFGENKRINVLIDEKCEKLDEGLTKTKLKLGGNYIEDDSKDYQHITTAAGYGIYDVVEYGSGEIENIELS